jgi:hypothetical protein
LQALAWLTATLLMLFPVESVPDHWVSPMTPKVNGVAKAEEAALRASAAQMTLRLEMIFIEGQVLVVMLNETPRSMPDS